MIAAQDCCYSSRMLRAALNHGIVTSISSSSLWRGRLLIVTAAVMWSTSGFFAKAPIFDDWPLETRGILLAFWRTFFACANIDLPGSPHRVVMDIDTDHAGICGHELGLFECHGSLRTNAGDLVAVHRSCLGVSDQLDLFSRSSHATATACCCCLRP